MRRLTPAITLPALVFATAAPALAAGDRVAPVSGTTHLEVTGKPKLKSCGDGGFVADVTFTGTMKSNDSRLAGALRLKLHESASKADDAIVTATGTLRDHSGHKAALKVYGADHGDDFDGILVAKLAHGALLVANWSSHQNADGSADGTFGTGGALTPKNTAVAANPRC